MSPVSRLCRFVWKRASLLSHRGGSEQIEPLHFLRALHHLYTAPPSLRPSERDEFAAFRALCEAVRMDALPSDEGPGGEPVAPVDSAVQHRSDRAKRLFATPDGDALDATTLLRNTLSELSQRGDLPQSLESPPNESLQGSANAPAPMGPDLPNASLTLPPFLRDLSASYRKTGTPPTLFGRRALLLEMVRVLNRKTRNNILLLGEAGVGKTALVQMLAYRLAIGKDPYPHADPTVVELSLGGLLDGSKHRGDLESKIQQVLSLSEQHPNLIVFIDEIHLLAIAENGILLEHLKPALSEGTFTCIGASTAGEFREFMAHNKAFTRRFDTIRVPEPTLDEMVRIIGAMVPDFERHYGTHISDETVARLIALCDSHVKNKRFPAKAIDLLDRACSSSTVAALSVNGVSDIHARTLRDADLVHVLAEQTGIPPYLLRDDDQASLSIFGNIASVLSDRIVGQGEAFQHVEDALLLAHTRADTRNGPLCTLMFVGPSGVGKTYTAELLSDYLFGDDLVSRINLSEYTEKHAVSRLIGSPPGYEGSRKEGLLHQLMRSKPHSILLLDEIDKAHPSVYDVLLQLFDKGYTLDNDGSIVDASHIVFIMTSNLSRDATLTGGAFRNEFVSRIDAIVEYASLTEPHLSTLLDRYVSELAERTRETYDVEIVVAEATRDETIREAAESGRGARALKALFRKRIELPAIRAFARQPAPDAVIQI